VVVKSNRSPPRPRGPHSSPTRSAPRRPPSSRFVRRSPSTSTLATRRRDPRRLRMRAPHRRCQSGAVPLTSVDRPRHLRQGLRADQLAAKERLKEGRDVVDGGDDAARTDDVIGAPHGIAEPRTIGGRPDRRRSVAGVLELEWTEDAVQHDLLERTAGDLFDHHPEDDVVDVRVTVLGPRARERACGGDLIQGPSGRPLQEVRVVQPARVVQELPDGDPPAVRKDAGEHVLEREAALLDQLEDDRGDERLGDAGGVEPVLRLRRAAGLGLAG
jgi:hypothetical protein